MKKLVNLKGAQKLNKSELQDIKGSGLAATRCNGSGTGGHFTEGCASVCIGKPKNHPCTINGYAAECTGNGCGFWFL
ncbi:hypothetical protein [Gilvibacter sediminis]|uniref:hypothetical protein n=1 Tax=Gilvibacter sediminis TaxID=379071 RepID=UPI0023500B0B|nr:hypothetical protein [Gilvibacter sediminis]MDC7997401.1 hypothetical protein [Gilvibacter sediminis]